MNDRRNSSSFDDTGNIHRHIVKLAPQTNICRVFIGGVAHINVAGVAGKCQLNTARRICGVG